MTTRAIEEQRPAATCELMQPGVLVPTRRARGDPEPVDERLQRVISAALPADAAPISALGFRTQLEAMADNSKAAIAADLTDYAAWCVEELRPPLPADPETLVRYLQALDAAARKPATLTRRIASLATVHRLCGLAPTGLPPTSDPMVRAALKAVRRRRGKSQAQAEPIRLGAALDPYTGRGFTLEALLAACRADLQGLRDSALLSLGYDAGLRVSELVAVTLADLTPERDGSATLHIPRSKTDQEQRGEDAWVSADTMRRIAAWRAASGVEHGPLFRRIHIIRRKARATQAPVPYHQIPGNTRNWQARLEGKPAVAALTIFATGSKALSRQGVNGIYRRVATAAYDMGLVDLARVELEAAVRRISTHSLRVGLTQDLFAAGADGAGISQALRWQSATTALRYARKLQVKSNAAARVLRELRR